MLLGGQHEQKIHVTLLTHLPRDKMAAISQTMFSDAFSWVKTFALWLIFHWSFL